MEIEIKKYHLPVKENKMIIEQWDCKHCQKKIHARIDFTGAVELEIDIFCRECRKDNHYNENDIDEIISRDYTIPEGGEEEIDVRRQIWTECIFESLEKGAEQAVQVADTILDAYDKKFGEKQ